MLAAFFYVPLLQCISNIRIQDTEDNLTYQKILGTGYTLSCVEGLDLYCNSINSYYRLISNETGRELKEFVEVKIDKMTYFLEDANLEGLDKSSVNYCSVLKDGTKFLTKGKYLSLLLADKGSVRIHGAEKVTEDGKTLVFNFKSGEKIVILNTKLYKEEEGGVYNVNPNKLKLNDQEKSDAGASNSTECSLP